MNLLKIRKRKRKTMILIEEEGTPSSKTLSPPHLTRFFENLKIKMLR
jgi:hypothetical protein